MIVKMDAMMNAMMARDYAFYQAQFAALQASENEFADALGLERVDLAWKKTIEREEARNMPTFPEMKREFSNNRALRAYALAIGVSAV